MWVPSPCGGKPQVYHIIALAASENQPDSNPCVGALNALKLLAIFVLTETESGACCSGMLRGDNTGSSRPKRRVRMMNGADHTPIRGVLNHDPHVETTANDDAHDALASIEELAKNSSRSVD